MAATKYQVLYRYINEATNTPITNDMDNAYEEVCEFYTDPHHKIFSSNSSIQGIAADEQQEMISFGNSSNNPKINMLFAYNGTKKIKHKKWVDEATGYIVRDWEQLKRSSIGNQGDFSKDFTTIDAATPEDGGTVVCNATVFKKYFPSDIIAISDESFGDLSNDYGKYYSEEYLYSLITKATYWALNTTSCKDHGTPPLFQSLQTGENYWGDAIFTSYSIGPISIGKGKELIIGYNNASIKAYRNSNDTYSKMVVRPEQVQTTTIPGHYEEVVDNPYLIKDTYKRIQLSPWFVNATYGSLEAALERAKLLVDMIGIDNVKLIKIVPIDQFVRIR